jgi:hypothetical protein
VFGRRKGQVEVGARQLMSKVPEHWDIRGRNQTRPARVYFFKEGRQTKDCGCGCMVGAPRPPDIQTAHLRFMGTRWTAIHTAGPLRRYDFQLIVVECTHLHVHPRNFSCYPLHLQAAWRPACRSFENASMLTLQLTPPIVSKKSPEFRPSHSLLPWSTTRLRHLDS